MTLLNHLEISNLRVFSNTELHPGQINLITGDNGSGKTTVLESLYLLSHGRSFRSHLIRAYVRKGETSSIVFAKGNSTSGESFTVGVQKSQSAGSIYKLDRTPVETLGELAFKLPMLILNNQSFDLLDGAPHVRRGYLDWGVFHVEHSYYSSWRRYQRALKQRNALLRNPGYSADAMEPWERELDTTGEVLHAGRMASISDLQRYCTLIFEQLTKETMAIEFTYMPGWDISIGLLENLVAQRERDEGRGYTQHGPHRADIKVLIDGRPAKEVLSRGQQKILVSAMIMAQAKLLLGQGFKAPVLLVDDITAELDKAHGARLCEALSLCGCQVFITCINVSDDVRKNLKYDKLFHVEQGIIHPIT